VDGQFGRARHESVLNQLKRRAMAAPSCSASARRAARVSNGVSRSPPAQPATRLVHQQAVITRQVAHLAHMVTPNHAAKAGGGVCDHCMRWFRHSIMPNEFIKPS